MARTSSAFQLSVGSLVSASLGVYLRNLIPFLFLGCLILGPWILLVFWFAESADAKPEDVLVETYGAILVQSLLTYVLTGAITYGVVQHLRGEPKGLAETIGKGFGSFFRSLGTGLYCGLMIFVFTLLLIVPGIIQSIRLYVALPASVMEGSVGSAAAKRSTQLVAGSGWQLFGAWLLIVILGGVFGAVVGAICGATIVDFDARSPWLQVGIQVPMNTFAATMMAVAYFQLRKGKENVDAKAIAKVFD